MRRYAKILEALGADGALRHRYVVASPMFCPERMTHEEPARHDCECLRT